MLQKLKDFAVSTHGKVTSISMAAGASLVAGTSCFAAADDTTVTSVTTQLTTIKDTALAVLAGAAGVAILLFGGIYAWRYGKKVFSVISK